MRMLALITVLVCGCTRRSVPPAEPPAAAPPGPIVEVATAPSLAIATAEPRAEARPEPVEPAPPKPWQWNLRADSNWLATPPPPPQSSYARWKQRARITVGQSHLDFAELSPDEKHLIVMSDAEATVRVYEARTRKLVGNYAVPGFTPGDWARGAIATWPSAANGDPRFVVGNTQGLKLYSGTTGALLATLHGESIWSLRWSPDGLYLLAGTADIGTQTSVIRVFERRGDQVRLVVEMQTAERIDGLALSRDNTLAAMTLYPSDSVVLVDLTSGTELWRERGPQFVGSVDISPGSDRVAVGGDRVVVFDLRDPKTNAAYAKLGNNVHQVRFTPSGDALAVSAYDGHARILSADPKTAQLKLLADLRHGGSANVYSLSFRRDGSALITSSGDRTVRQWGR